MHSRGEACPAIKVCPADEPLESLGNKLLECLFRGNDSVEQHTNQSTMDRSAL